MSKNVAIKEGQTAKSFSDVAKLKTDLVGGGTATWVPEDETQLVEKTFTQNGEYLPSSDNAYGFGKVTVDIDLPTKSITANGTYNASSDNKEGWSKVTVNVPTEGASGTDTSGNPYSITDDDFGLPTYTDSNGDDYDVEVDTDPQTGEPTVTLTKLPKSIVVTAGSLTYNDGDAFDKSRYTVKANWDTAGGTQSDVTASCTFYPANGTILHYGTEYTMTVEWTYKGRTYRTAQSLTIEESHQGLPDGDYSVSYGGNTYSIPASFVAQVQQLEVKTFFGNIWHTGFGTIEGGVVEIPEGAPTIAYCFGYCTDRYGDNAMMFCGSGQGKYSYLDDGSLSKYYINGPTSMTVTRNGVSKTVEFGYAEFGNASSHNYPQLSGDVPSSRAAAMLIAFGGYTV